MKARDIAIVEDDPDDQDFICLALEETDAAIKLRRFNNGQEFLQYMATTNTFPDIVITDLRMPMVDGWELISNIKNNEETKHIPVAVLSTSSNISDFEKATSLGACIYHTKPHSEHEYMAIVTSIIEYCRS